MCFLNRINSVQVPCEYWAVKTSKICRCSSCKCILFSITTIRSQENNQVFWGWNSDRAWQYRYNSHIWLSKHQRYADVHLAREMCTLFNTITTKQSYKQVFQAIQINSWPSTIVNDEKVLQLTNECCLGFAGRFTHLYN